VFNYNKDFEKICDIYINIINFCTSFPVGKITNIQHSKYSAMLSKIHSYRLLSRRFCTLGYKNYNKTDF